MHAMQIVFSWKFGYDFKVMGSSPDNIFKL